MSGSRLETVVADTSALVSLAVPRTVGGDDPGSPPDPLQYLLTSCLVTLPASVVSELRDMTQYEDLHASAAANVLAAREYYDVEDPYDRTGTPDARPVFGLDAGETDGIVLANASDADALLTDEFGGTNFPLIHAGLDDVELLPRPRLLREYARNGHLTADQATVLIETVGRHRSWMNSPYVRRTLDRLEE